MAGTLVDSNVILDVLTEDARWYAWLSTALAQCADEGPLYIKTSWGTLLPSWGTLLPNSPFVYLEGNAWLADGPRAAVLMAVDGETTRLMGDVASHDYLFPFSSRRQQTLRS